MTSDDADLRNALIEAFNKADDETMDLLGPTLEELADIALAVFKDRAPGQTETFDGSQTVVGDEKTGKYFLPSKGPGWTRSHGLKGDEPIPLEHLRGDHLD